MTLNSARWNLRGPCAKLGNPALHMARADSTCNYDNMRGVAETAGAWIIMLAHYVCGSDGQTCGKLVAARMQWPLDP